MGAVRTFPSAAAFRKWLEKNHGTEREIVIRCYRAKSGLKGMTYREALDEALCFGWIDGVRRSLDDASFSTRFTPRRQRSKWSRVNIKRAQELEAEGRMCPAGRAALAAKDRGSGRRYSFEEEPRQLPPKFEKSFRANREAWHFFRSQAPWYQRTSIFWVMEAKREETQARRLDHLISSCQGKEPIKPLNQARLRTD